MFVIPTADDLVEFIKDFTGSTNDNEIKKCVFMAEMSMRNIELPALRSDPYAPENIAVADHNGRVPIPGDMNKPILFFKQGRQFITTATCTGSNGSNVLTLVTTPNQALSVGMIVSGEGIPLGTSILSFPSSSTVTISMNLTQDINETVTFNTTSSQSSQVGPWIVYDRIGDRDIIAQSMIAQLYLQPVNVPAVIRGKFSEVGQMYEFLPYVAQGDLINLYYYKAWPLLFSPADDQLVALTGTITNVSGSGPWTTTITIGDTSQLTVGDTIIATDGTGNLGTGASVVASIVNGTTFTVTDTGGSSPTTGNITNIIITNITVQNNAVLSTWPEGYVYATLREYYIKRHNSADAAIYQAKYDDAWNIIEDQNNKGKWSGGHTRLSSVWQPRQYRQYNIK